MQINHLRCFLTVSKLNSFSAAADEMFVSQSSLSKYIIALEKELNVKLFDRSRRIIRLTEAGEVFHKNCLNIMKDYYHMVDEMKEFSIAGEGVLKIATIPVMAQYNLVSLLAQFRSQYPKIQIILEERESNYIIGALRHNECEIGIMRNNYLNKDEFSFIPLASDTLAAVLSAQHVLADLKSINLVKLMHEQFILLDKSSGIYDIAVQACNKVGFYPNVLYTNTRIETINQMVADNVGVSLLMLKIASYFNDKRIRLVPVKESVTSYVGLCKLNSKKLTSNALLFWNFISEHKIKMEE